MKIRNFDFYSKNWFFFTFLTPIISGDFRFSFKNTQVEYLNIGIYPHKFNTNVEKFIISIVGSYPPAFSEIPLFKHITCLWPNFLEKFSPNLNRYSKILQVKSPYKNNLLLIFYKNLKFLSFAQNTIFDFKIKKQTKILTNISRKLYVRF